MACRAAKDWTDRRVARAVEIQLGAPWLKLPQCMRAANFTTKDSQNPNKQMWVRRRLAKKRKASLPVPEVTFDVDGNESITSSLTKSTKTNASRPAPQAKITRCTSTAAQKRRANHKAAKAHYSESLKVATRLYAAEKAKDKGGKSARAVAEEVKFDFGGVGPSE